MINNNLARKKISTYTTKETRFFPRKSLEEHSQLRFQDIYLQRELATQNDAFCIICPSRTR